MATMQPYYNLVENVLTTGRKKDDRTGTGTISKFGAQMRFDLSKGFPLNTLKNTPMYRIVNELLWFLSGSTDDKELALMDRVYREAQKTYAAFSKQPKEDRLNLQEYFYGCMPRNTSLDNQYDTLTTFYSRFPELQNEDTELTMSVIGRVINFLLARGKYEWLYELTDKPTIWDEWATYNTVYCHEQLNWVMGRVPEAKGDGDSILVKFNNWDGTVAEKNEWFYKAVIDLSEKYQLHTGDALHRRTIGPMYGKQWRAFGEYDVDQIGKAIETLRKNPTSRRICISAWDPTYLPDDSITPHENVDRGDMALAPCHAFFQFYAEELTLEELMTIEKVQVETAYCAPEVLREYVAEKQLRKKIPKYRLSCQFYCRSQDLFLGTPFNIASYALLTHMIATEVGMEVGDLIWTGGDVHIYNNHVEQVKEMLTHDCGPLPTLKLHHAMGEVMFITATDVEVLDYNPYPTIAAPVAI